MTKYQNPRAQRTEDRHVGGRFKAGLLAPVMAHKVMGSEGGRLEQRCFFELDPIPGRLMSSIFAEVICCYVPLQAIHALKNPTADYPGSNDVIRHELAQGNPVTDLEAENEISKRLGINPRSVSGTKYVDESARLAYLCAVNYLRQRKYVKASLVTKTETAILPAILSKTVLERLNGVLDPEDRVDGAIDLQGLIPIEGLAVGTSATTVGPQGGLQDSEGGGITYQNEYRSNLTDIHLKAQAQDGRLAVYADLGQGAAEITLRDFYRAEMQDRLTREMRAFIDANPEHGEEMVTRWAAGLSLDVGRQPFVLWEDKVALTSNVQRPTDGASIDDVRSYPATGIEFSVTIPRTEFGGVVVTMMCVKPDEVLSSQPHPMFTEAWAADNFVADELAIDPVPVTMRDVDSDVATPDEGTTVFWGANHGLRKAYRQYGWNRHLNVNDVAAQTSIWQLEVPASVTPETVNYPSPLPQTPFADTLAEVCTYGIKSMLNLATPTIFGPSPIEELAAIETEGVFDGAQT